MNGFTYRTADVKSVTEEGVLPPPPILSGFAKECDSFPEWVTEIQRHVGEDGHVLKSADDYKYRLLGYECCCGCAWVLPLIHVVDRTKIPQMLLPVVLYMTSPSTREEVAREWVKGGTFYKRLSEIDLGVA